MEQLLLYVQDPQAIKKWSSAATDQSQLINDLDQVQGYEPADVLLLAQLQADSACPDKLDGLLEKGYGILLFSNLPDTEEAFVWFQKGIKGYLNTHANAERIMQAISVIKDGHIWLGQTVMNALIQKSAEVEEQKQPNDGWRKHVTDREAQTLALVMEGKSNNEIAEKMFISERTVKAHMSKLLEKLGAKDRLGLVLKIQNWQEWENKW